MAGKVIDIGKSIQVEPVCSFCIQGILLKSSSCLHLPYVNYFQDANFKLLLIGELLITKYSSVPRVSILYQVI